MLDTIYIVRHGFRMAWHGNQLGLSPTGRPRDPVLTAHGIDQVKLLGQHFAQLPADQRPQLIVSSPYYRCVQTSGPTAEQLGLDIHIEPGIVEWFPPVPAGTGVHPLPMRTSTVSSFSERIAPIGAWAPLAYPMRRGESIQELHTRARRVLELIEARCKELGVQRVLVVSHAATIIAMGRALLEAPGKETTDWETGRGIEIGAGTASISLYRRRRPQDAGGAPQTEAPWQQELNGWCGYLPDGVEREWTFKDIPGNVEEPGMGEGWKDEEALEDEGLMLQLEKAGSTSVALAAAALAQNEPEERTPSNRPRF